MASYGVDHGDQHCWMVVLAGRLQVEDRYDVDPFFTTSTGQGMADRRSAGASWKVGLQFTSANQKWVFIATDAWYNYGNALAPENTNIWVLDGRYRFSHVGKGPYRV